MTDYSWIAPTVSVAGAVGSAFSACKARQATARTARWSAEVAEIERRRSELTAAYETVWSAFERFDQTQGSEHLDVLLLAGLERLSACDAATPSLLQAVEDLRVGIVSQRSDLGMSLIRNEYRACRDGLNREHRLVLGRIRES